MQGSRKIMYKGFVKDCLSVMCDMSQPSVFPEENSNHESCAGEQLHENSVTQFALPELRKSTGTALKELLVMVCILAIYL